MAHDIHCKENNFTLPLFCTVFALYCWISVWADNPTEWQITVLPILTRAGSNGWAGTRLTERVLVTVNCCTLNSLNKYHNLGKLYKESWSGRQRGREANSPFTQNQYCRHARQSIHATCVISWTEHSVPDEGLSECRCLSQVKLLSSRAKLGTHSKRSSSDWDENMYFPCSQPLHEKGRAIQIKAWEWECKSAQGEVQGGSSQWLCKKGCNSLLD